ncbi:SMC-Scp complex subunit ScpB [Bermanella marisrubri]|uniref:Predicted transcriptional regulator n=1 Tax=Bermanella marisrubri TaxID=207949 RepID=Q1N5M0_9GAMM|nr:SMC-Scp complex subunit ScpB [Bermanella marisrubri]EAT13922.1 Predicted transcriptional regulator [Oceanobacter sp. RED65] [Bermanella marisrubri]QIZ84675.1 SMC-Scp complex subunit ScpB [Bermanella marisrubri]
MINDALLEQIVEAALMASGQTLSVDRMQTLFEEHEAPSKQRLEIIVQRIYEKCEHKGYELKKVATGYRFQVKQDLSNWVSRLWEEKPQRYSRALLETLSIIAYRQPVTRGEIEDVRGVAVSSHITKTLQEREWIQVVGHRDVPGRPAMYATTKMFLDYFNLESLDQLPTLEEIQEIADANHALEFEDKQTEEGNYDFSYQQEEQEDSENLKSAQEDLAAAEALVESVENSVFKQPEEEEENHSVEETDSLQDGENLLAALEDASEAERSSNEDDEADVSLDEMDDEAMAEATIARMLAEQEALINSEEKKLEEKDIEEYVSKPVTIEESWREQDTGNESTHQAYQAGPSVFGESSSADEDEEALLAAREEEMMAQLEAEQEALMQEQEEEQTQESSASGSKSLSDLANKLDD